MKKIVKTVCVGAMLSGIVIFGKEAAAQADDAAINSYVGDWNLDGAVKLDDAQNVLEAALGMQSANQQQVFQCSFSRESGRPLSLQDAVKTLNTALGTQELFSVCSIEHTALYESLTERKPYNTEKKQIFSSKEQAIEWAKFYNRDEIAQQLAYLTEQELQGKKILLISSFTYANQLQDVNVSDMLIKKTASSNGLYMRVEDYNTVLAHENHFYEGIYLIEDPTEKISGFGRAVMYDVKKDIKGGEQVAVRQYNDFLSSGESRVIIQTPQELQEFKETVMQRHNLNSETEAANMFPSIWQALNKADSYFNDNILIYNAHTYGYYYYDTQHVNWSETADEIKFSLDTSYFFDHKVNAIPAIGIPASYLLEISKDLVGGRKISFEMSNELTYVDFAPKQETLALQVKGNEAISSYAPVRTEEERQALLTALEESCEEKDSDNYAKLKTLLEEADITAQDLLFVFSAMNELPNSEMEGLDLTMYVDCTDTELSAYFDRSESGLRWMREDFNDDILNINAVYHYVTVLYLDHGAIGTRFNYSRDYVFPFERN